MEAAGPSQVELTVIDWFKDWLGYPEQAAGLLLSGGSAANMTALACARESLLGPMSDRVVAYVSDQAHSSLARAARLLGFRPDQLRVLPAGTDLQLAAEALARAIEADVAAGRAPLFASVSGGATNTGAIDPLDELADVCRDHGVWLHVDAAYGGFAALTARGRDALRGIEARRLDRARPAQVALPADGVRRAARPRGPPAAARVRDRARLPQGRRRSPRARSTSPTWASSSRAAGGR